MPPSARPFTAVLRPLGLPVEVEAPTPALLGAVARAFGPADAHAPEGGTLRLRLTVGTAGEAGPPRLRVDGSRLALSGGGARGGADAVRGEAWCAVSPALAADPDRAAAEAAEPLLLFLLTRAGRVPVHAAGVVVGGTAALLAGRSGVGKSTLAHAAARAGLGVLSDDTVYVQLRPRLAVHGLPRPIHLLDTAEGEGRLRAGRWKRAVHAGPPPAPADRAALFLLERGGAAALRPLAPEAAVALMTAGLEGGFDHFRDALPAAVRALAAGGAWRLVLSRDPGDALALVRRALGGAAV